MEKKRDMKEKAKERVKLRAGIAKQQKYQKNKITRNRDGGTVLPPASSHLPNSRTKNNNKLVPF